MSIIRMRVLAKASKLVDNSFGDNFWRICKRILENAKTSAGW